MWPHYQLVIQNYFKLQITCSKYQLTHHRKNAETSSAQVHNLKIFFLVHQLLQ